MKDEKTLPPHGDIREIDAMNALWHRRTSKMRIGWNKAENVAHDLLLYRKQIVGRQICKIRETIPKVHNGVRSHESDMSIVLVKW